MILSSFVAIVFRIGGSGNELRAYFDEVLRRMLTVNGSAMLVMVLEPQIMVGSLSMSLCNLRRIPLLTVVFSIQYYIKKAQKLILCFFVHLYFNDILSFFDCRLADICILFNCLCIS